MSNSRVCIALLAAALAVTACDREASSTSETSSEAASAAESDETGRSVETVVAADRRKEGGGFIVHRTIGSESLSMLDPFLLLDEMGPVEYAPGEAVGAPDHPHKGFETVTYMLDGELTHKDSTGRSGTVTPGAVQWMTAGAGLVHSEMPSDEMMENGGRMHGFQLWVNLPKADKDAEPNYQGFEAEEIPEATGPDGQTTARVIAGEAFGTEAVVETRTPITFLHLTIRPGGDVDLPVPEGHNAAAYLISGTGTIGPDDREVDNQHMVVFADDGDHVGLAVPSSAETPLDLLFLAGQPIDEPVARRGPFVMNTDDELREAIRQFRSGEMGEIE